MNVAAALQSAAVSAAVRADAIARYPQESCGFVTATGYVAKDNVAADPTRSFKIRPREWRSSGILAVVHSHPDGPEAPSARDMERQIDTAVPWGLVLTDGEAATEPYWWGAGIADDVPLLRRPFRHGPTGTDGCGDCYALVRDWYRVERGVGLPEFPRDDVWWESGGDLYRDGFGKAGFVDRGAPRDLVADLEPGEVILFQIRSEVPNHAAVYLGDGLMVHHPASLDSLRGRDQSLSRREPAHRWIVGHGTHVLRYRGSVGR